MADLIVYFKKPADWADTLQIHFWDTRPPAAMIDWPGVPMSDDGNGWFVYRFDGISTARLLFHDNRGRQTQDLQRDRLGWYTLDGGWFDHNPDAPSSPSDAGAGGAGGAGGDPPGVTPAPTVPTPRPVTLTGKDFREETIYFLLTARFYEGDPSTSFFCRDRIKFNRATGQPEDPHWRGDFKGLIQRLDYIRDLGFTAIWITPPVENRSGLDYHGYHAYDWTRVDPRLESPDATYQDLIDAAHASAASRSSRTWWSTIPANYGIRGKVWIDHLPIKYYVPQGSEQGRVNHGPYQGNLGNYAWPNRDDIDNPVAPEWYRERHAMDPEGKVPLVDPKTGETVPKPGYNPGRFFGIDANHLDPEWYMQHGFICGGDWESAAVQLKHIAGDCINLATDRQNVKDYLIGSINRYLDMGVDALRIDTVKHVPRDNLLEYVNAWKAHKPGPIRVRRGAGEGLRLGRSGRRRQRPVVHPAVVVHPAGPRPARPQFRRRFRLPATRFRLVLHLPRQREPGQLRRVVRPCWRWTGFTATPPSW
jgi:hypothetical protein